MFPILRGQLSRKSLLGRCWTQVPMTKPPGGVSISEETLHRNPNQPGGGMRVKPSAERSGSYSAGTCEPRVGVGGDRV